MIDLKYDNPVSMIVLDGELLLEEDKLNITNGVVFEGKHYGFSLVSENGNEVKFDTQCPITGIDTDKYIIRVYEEGKFIPWRINKETGEVLDHAKFLNISRKDIRYLREHFGLSEESVDEVNSYYEFNNTLRKTID